MTSKKAFCICFGFNLHFTQMSYSVIKYGMNTKAAIAKFESMTQEQKYRFEYLSSKYVDTQDLVYACIGTQFDDVSIQYGTKDDITETFMKFKGRREAMTYKLKSDISKHESSGQLPLDKLIFKYLIGEFSPEYILLLCYNTNKLEELYESPNLSWARDKILKLIKYSDFFNAKKYLSLIQTNENHACI